jgi:hypothetical protein
MKELPEGEKKKRWGSYLALRSSGSEAAGGRDVEEGTTVSRRRPRPWESPFATADGEQESRRESQRRGEWEMN